MSSIPAPSDPVWDHLISGRITRKFMLFAANLAMARAARIAAENPVQKHALIHELYKPDLRYVVQPGPNWNLGRAQTVVFNGETGEASADRMVVLRAEPPEAMTAEVGSINLFQEGGGTCFRFPNAGCSAEQCRFNGEPGSLFDYVKDHARDLRLPLLANLSGEMIM